MKMISNKKQQKMFVIILVVAMLFNFSLTAQISKALQIENESSIKVESIDYEHVYREKKGDAECKVDIEKTYIEKIINELQNNKVNALELANAVCFNSNTQDDSYLGKLILSSYAMDFLKTIENNLSMDGFLVNPVQEWYEVYDSGWFKDECMKEDDSEAQINSMVEKNIQIVWSCFLNDHPEIFWLKDKMTPAKVSIEKRLPMVFKENMCKDWIFNQKNIRIRTYL